MANLSINLKLSLFSLQMMRQLVKSSWLLHLSCNKRRVAPIAALLSAVLHPAVFSDLNMHETDGKEKGPLKWVSLLVINRSSVLTLVSLLSFHLR